MLKKLVMPGLLIIASSLTVHALIPTLYLEKIYEDDKVFLKVAGQPSASVSLFYTPDFASTSQSAIIGWTDDNGEFWKVFKTSTYRIDASLPVFVMINGYMSATATWPYAPPVVPPFSVATTSISMPVLTTSTVTISGSGRYYIADYQSSYLISAVTSTSSLTLFGKIAGTAPITVCQSNSACSIITVNVVATSAPQKAPVADATSAPSGTGTTTTWTMPLLEAPSGPVIPVTTPSSYKFYILLKYGSRGKEVEELQKRLIEEGFFQGDVTGFYGAVTAYAVREYQRSHHIPVLGILGPLTRGKLNES